MVCYLFRFTYEGENLISGIAYNLDKIYRKNSPLYCLNKTVLSEECFKRDINFYMTNLEYMEYSSEAEAKEAFTKLSNSEELEINWKIFKSKTYDFDKEMYVRFLKNRLEALRAINHYDQALHRFLFENFNTKEDYVWFKESYKFPFSWESFDKKARKEYTRKLLHLDKKQYLSPEYYIKVFAGYETDFTENEIIVRYKIKSSKIPYLMASIYNLIIFTSHTINQLCDFKTPIDKTELPYFNTIKPIRIYYTDEQYKKDCILRKN